jgi:hypothetical protein
MEEAMCTEREREREKVQQTVQQTVLHIKVSWERISRCISNINFASVFSRGCHTVDSNMIT